MASIRWILIVISIIFIGLISALFVFKNPALVTVDLLIYKSASLSVAMWLILAFVTGAILGLLAGIPAFIKYKAMFRRVSRQLAGKEKELQKLKGDLLKD